MPRHGGNRHRCSILAPVYTHPRTRACRLYDGIGASSRTVILNRGKKQFIDLKGAQCVGACCPFTAKGTPWGAVLGFQLTCAFFVVAACCPGKCSCQNSTSGMGGWLTSPACTHVTCAEMQKKKTDKMDAALEKEVCTGGALIMNACHTHMQHHGA